EREDQAIRNFSEESAAQGGMEPLTLEDPGISQRFVGWTSDQVEARYLLTPELMLAISDAAERMESDRIAVSFRDSWMYFAVVLDEDRFSLSMQPDEDQGYQIARSIYDDLVAFLSLIEHFNLNTRIWSKVGPANTMPVCPVSFSRRVGRALLDKSLAHLWWPNSQVGT